MNDGITLKIAAVRCQKEGAGNRWRLRASLAAGADFAIVAKLGEANRSVLEFYLLRMADHDGRWIPLPARGDRRTRSIDSAMPSWRTCLERQRDDRDGIGAPSPSPA